MTLDARTKPRNVFRFRIVHLEQAAGAKAEGRQVRGRFRMGTPEALELLSNDRHCFAIARGHAGGGKDLGDVIAVYGGEVLANLLAASMAMEIAPAAQVHQDIEDEAVAAMELS